MELYQFTRHRIFYAIKLILAYRRINYKNKPMNIEELCNNKLLFNKL